MSISRLHTHYQILIHPDGMSATLIDGVTDQNIDNQIKRINDRTSGDVYSRFQGIVESKPTLSFSTVNIAKALDAVGLTGLKIASASNVGVVFYAFAHDEGGTRKSGSAHRSYTVREGLMIPKKISCSHGQDAKIDYEIITTYDGSNDPIVIADTVSLTALDGDDERFTLHSLSIGGVTLSQLESVEINFNVKGEGKASDGDIYDTFSWIDEILPTITATGSDIEWMKSSNIPILGVDGAHADTVVKFRKRALGGTFVADLTAEHIAVTACGMAIIDKPFQGGENAQTSVNLEARHDGTNVPLIFDTTSAL
jgi:hypothetical protein